MRFKLTIFSLLSLVYVTNANDIMDYDTELYSSSTLGLLKLLEIENKFVLNLKKYTEAQEEKLETLKVYLKTLNRVSHKSKKELEKHVSNPLNAFGMIRRMRNDWRKLQVYRNDTAGTAQLKDIQKLLAEAPTEVDMKESLLGINRIELTYDLNPIDISQGRLQDKQFNYTLSMRDCLALANHKYATKDYGRAVLWYRAALKLESEPYFETYNEVLGNPLDGVRQKLIRSRMLQALKGFKIKLSDDEAHARADEIIGALDSTELANYVNELLNQDDAELIKQLNFQDTEPTAHFLGCRGSFPKRTNLSCRYNFTTTPFLRLAPLKMEQISHDPYIVMYHNVLSEGEIEEMKRQSVHMGNGLSGAVQPDQKEPPEIVARVDWLVERTPFMERINQRITDMTGFDVSEFRALQVANFGIGNYFKPHYDYIYADRVSSKDVSELGDRLASLIFYASEVPQGGATVFPELQVAVPPQKGNSLFWYNTFDDGTPDPRTLHSVCPVIVGARWTLTKWLHIVPQLFIKPCSIRSRQQSNSKKNVSL